MNMSQAVITKEVVMKLEELLAFFVLVQRQEEQLLVSKTIFNNVKGMLIGAPESRVAQEKVEMR